MEVNGVVSISSDADGTVFDWNLPSNFCQNFLQELGQEYDLEEAEKQARESGSITPLVKQELKLLIQSRRLSRGKEELRVGFEEPPRHQLTPAEEERRKRRKEQNKKAAKRFRQNKKFREAVLLEEISLLEGKNEGLRAKQSELRQLKDSLLRHLHSHLVICPFQPLPPPSTPPPAQLSPSRLSAECSDASGTPTSSSSCPSSSSPFACPSPRPSLAASPCPATAIFYLPGEDVFTPSLSDLYATTSPPP